MEPGLDPQTFLLVAGFLLLVGMSAWHRHRLELEMREMPDEVRERLDLEPPDLRSVRRYRRRTARRLVMRGLPDWVPLSAEGRRHLRLHRLFALGAALWIIFAPAAAWDAWMLVPIVGVPALAILALHAWLDGPWEQAP